MSQSTDLTLAPNITGTAQRTEVNDIVRAIVTQHSGSTRPSYLAGSTTGLWIKTVSSTLHELYYFDGTDDILFTSFNITSNTASFPLNITQFGSAVEGKSANYTVVAADNGKLLGCHATGGNITISFNPLSTLPTNFFVMIKKTDISANVVTLDPSGSETIDGNTTITLARPQDAVLIFKSSSTNFFALYFLNQDNYAKSSNQVFTGNIEVPWTDNTSFGVNKAASTAHVNAYYALKDSPNFTGSPTAPTAGYGNYSSLIATTAFVQNAVAGASSGAKWARITSYNGGGTQYNHVFHSNCVFFYYLIIGAGGGAAGNRSSSANYFAPYGRGGGGGAIGEGYIARSDVNPYLTSGYLRCYVAAGGAGGRGELWNVEGETWGQNGQRTVLGENANMLAYADGGWAGQTRDWGDPYGVGPVIVSTTADYFGSNVSGNDYTYNGRGGIGVQAQLGSEGVNAGWGGATLKQGGMSLFFGPGRANHNPGAGGNASGSLGGGSTRAGGGQAGKAGFIKIVEFIS